MKYFPIFIDLEKASVLIVGGGEMALQKLRLLAKTQARIVVVAPQFSSELKRLAEQHQTIELVHRDFALQDVLNKRLVYAASGDGILDDLVTKAAQDAGILLNKVDCPLDCDFITPSIVDRDPIIVAIGTEGSAPLLAREIKAHLDEFLPANYGALGKMARKIRPLILERIHHGRARLRLWETLLKGAFRDAVLSGDEVAAEKNFQSELKKSEDALALNASNDQIPARTAELGEHTHQMGEGPFNKGTVALVGAGPGDPDLLTLKALHRLQMADVLVVDRLVNPDILDYARRDAKQIYVGKQAGVPSISQEEINQILVREALAGARVVRIKGGDPSVFGRIQEELKACQLMGIEVEIIPGISAAQAASASIQLPLTFRGKHRSITLITAATKDQIVASDVMSFMKAGRPFAIYMGVKLAGEIVSSMSNAGVEMSAQIVIVENASRENERVFSAPLKDLEVAIKTFEIAGPAIFFVGLSYEEMGLKPDSRILQLPESNVVQLNERIS